MEEHKECNSPTEGMQHVLKVAVTLGETETVGNLIVQDIVRWEPGTAEDEKRSGEEKADRETDETGSTSQTEQPVTGQLCGSGETEGTSESSDQPSGSLHSKMHLCRLCGSVLDSSQDLLEHVQQHLSRGDSCTVTCHVCSRSFPSPGLLVQHLQAHSIMELVTSSAATKPEDGRETKCAECGQKFSAALLLYQHLLMLHTASSKLHCPLCSATFSGSRQDKFLDHLMTHAAKPEVQCPVCGKKFVSQARLDVHMKTHGPREKKHLCDLCGKPFFQKFYYQKHMKKQHGIENILEDGSLQASSQHDGAPSDSSAVNDKAQTELKFSCQICGKAFRTKGFMIRHMKAHAEHGPVLEHLHCGVCNAVFMSEQEKRQHVKQHSFKYDCGLCSEKFTLHKFLLKHWHTDHPDYRPFKCGKCDKVYKHDYDRFRHEMSHEGKRPYQCPQCPRQLWSRPNLKQHILIFHSNIERKKQFPCNVCGKLYYTKHAANNHMRTAHASRREYECLFCPKKFKTRQALETHSRIHTGEEPYRCKHCGKSFRSYCLIRQHIIYEHEGGHRIWKCQDCESDFRMKDHLASHVRKVHWQCFQCVDRFPSRKAAIKHRCNQIGEELYLKHHGVQIQRPSLQTVVGTNDKVVQINSIAQRDVTSSETIAAAESVETESVLPYTLTVSGDGKPIVKMPAYNFRKKGVRRNFPKLVSESDVDSRSDDKRVTEVVHTMPLTAAQDGDRHTQVPVSSVKENRSAVVCEALPQAVSLSPSVTSSPSKLSGDRGTDFSPRKFVNLCSSGVPCTQSNGGKFSAACVNGTSNPSKIVSTSPLIVADFPGTQDHDYKSTASLGVMESLPEDIAQTILQQGISLTENTTVIVFDEHKSSGNTVARTVYPPQQANSDSIPLDSFFACLNENESTAGGDSSGRHKEMSAADSKASTVDTETGAKSMGSAGVDKYQVTRKRTPSSKRSAAKTVSRRAKRAKTSAGMHVDIDSDHAAEWAKEAEKSESLFGASSAEQDKKKNELSSMGKGVFIKVGEGDFQSVYAEDEMVSDSTEEEQESKKSSGKSVSWHKTDESRRSSVCQRKRLEKYEERKRQDSMRFTAAGSSTGLKDCTDGIVSRKEPSSIGGPEDNFKAEVYMDFDDNSDFEDTWDDEDIYSSDEDSQEGNTQPHAKNACTDTELDNKVRIKISHASDEEDQSGQEERYQDLTSHAGEHEDADVNQSSSTVPSSRGHSGVKHVTKNVSDQAKGGKRGAKQARKDSKSESTTQQSQCLPVVKQPLTLQLMKKGNLSAPLQQQKHFSTQCPGEEAQRIDSAIQIVRRNFRCGFCEKIVSTQVLLQDHLLKVHKFEEFYQCQHCFVNTPTFSSLTAHFEQHAKELNMLSNNSARRNGGVLNRPQQVGPLWEATFIAKEKQHSVFVSV